MFRVYNPNFLLSISFENIFPERTAKAALEMTTNEGEDDDDIDFDDEDELLRRDSVRLLAEITFLEETSYSSSLRNGYLDYSLATHQQ